MCTTWHIGGRRACEKGPTNVSCCTNVMYIYDVQLTHPKKKLTANCYTNRGGGTDDLGGGGTGLANDW